LRQVDGGPLTARNFPDEAHEDCRQNKNEEDQPCSDAAC